jgi:tetratricopeptide (TPR) repeat protein
MKRIAILLNIMLFTEVILAQQTVDYLLKSKALVETGKQKDAIELLSDELTRVQDSRLFIERAGAYMANGDYTDALKDYQSANKLSIASGDYGLARIYAIKGEVAASLSHLDQNLGSGYKKSEKEILLDPAFGMIENTPEWRQFWKKERYTVFESKISEIEYYISAGKKEEANSVLSELAGSYPENNATLYAKALVSFSMEKFSEAANILTKLLATEKKNEQYLRLLSKVQTASGNMTGAADTYSELINMGVADAGLFFSRAECYRKTGETERALKDIGRFLDLYPQDKEALSLAGKIEAESGDYLKALDYFSRNLKLHPNNPECYIDRANSYFVSRTWVYATADYSMALDLKPDNAEVWLNKGISLLNSGKTDDACHDFRMALHLGNKKAAGYISSNCIK